MKKCIYFIITKFKLLIFLSRNLKQKLNNHHLNIQHQIFIIIFRRCLNFIENIFVLLVDHFYSVANISIPHHLIPDLTVTDLESLKFMASSKLSNESNNTRVNLHCILFPSFFGNTLAMYRPKTSKESSFLYYHEISFFIMLYPQHLWLSSDIC